MTGQGTKPRRWRPLVLSVVLPALVLSGCASTEPVADTAADPNPAAADPNPAAAADPNPAAAADPNPAAAADPSPAAAGTLIDATPIEALPGQRAWRISYHSRNLEGADIAVTGLLVTPEHGGSDLPLITYGHPTTGLGDACTPSRSGVRSLPVTDGFTRHGWALVMSDYPGLGTSAPHRYLVGADEGHSMLDAARAAGQVPGSGVSTASPVAVVGFSQGGHAASFAAQEAPAYAPELDIRGVALAAPVSDVGHFAARAEGRSDQLGVLVAIVAGFTEAYPELDPRAVLTDAVVDDLGIVERRCIGELNDDFDRPVGEVVRAPATSLPAFQARFAENLAGTGPVAQPVLIVQGDRDPTVAPADSHALAQRWCGLGTIVQEVVLPGANHGILADDHFAPWLGDRFAGRPPETTC